MDLVRIVDRIGSSKERLIVVQTTLTFGLDKIQEFKEIHKTFYFLLLTGTIQLIYLSLDGNAQILCIQTNVISLTFD